MEITAELDILSMGYFPREDGANKKKNDSMLFHHTYRNDNFYEKVLYIVKSLYFCRPL
jgi:hypothetical protein